MRPVRLRIGLPDLESLKYQVLTLTDLYARTPARQPICRQNLAATTTL